MKKILLCCASGIATSTAVKLRLSKALDERGYEGEYKITHCNIYEAAKLTEEHDFCVTTVNKLEDAQCPVILGVAFLTGRGLETAMEQVIEQMEQ